MWDVTPTDLWDWDTLKAKIVKHGVRNSLLIAQTSDAFAAQMLQINESFEPLTSNIYIVHALSKQFPAIKSSLLRDLIEKGVWNQDMYNKIISNGGSIQVSIVYFKKLRKFYKLLDL